MTKLETHGFLATEISHDIARLRNEFADVVREAEAASEAATTQLFQSTSVERPLSDHLAVSFWIRCISSCQAAILLGERGMGIEGLTMLRNAFENLFTFAAIIKDPTVVSKLDAKDLQERSKHAIAIKKNKESFDVLTPELQAELEEYIRSAPSPAETITIFETARLAGLESFYHTVYRTLSREAAHPSYTTAGHAFVDDITDIRYGPSPGNLNEVFGLARDCLNIGRGFITPVLFPT
jgi:hypothetical protein